MQQVCVPVNRALGTAVMQVLFLSDEAYNGPGSASVTAYVPPAMQAAQYPRSWLHSMPVPMPTASAHTHYYFVQDARVHACVVRGAAPRAAQQGREAVSVSYVDMDGSVKEKLLLPQLLLLPSPSLAACIPAALAAAPRH